MEPRPLWRGGVFAEQRNGRLQSGPWPDRQHWSHRHDAQLDCPPQEDAELTNPDLLLKQGRVRVVTGSPGGRTIPNTVLWVVLNLVEFGAEPGRPWSAPRTHHQWFPDVLVLEGRSWAEATRQALTSMGHKLGTNVHQGNANTIVVDADGKLQGIADRRRSTAAAAGD